jgi:DNA-binding LacI/PurR family transcriptional regulator
MAKNTDRQSKETPSRRVTGQEIADMLGVSAMTVSRALNDRGYVHEETKQKVIAAAKKMGYSPNSIAKSLVLKRTHTIGVVVPEITHSFFPEAIRGIEEISYRNRYDLIFTHSAEDDKREWDAIRTLESKRVDGILISIAESVADYQQYKELIDMGVPIVFFDRCAVGIGASCVSVDDEESAKKITEHLLDHGYRRLAHLNGPSNVSIGRGRQNGFIRALKERGIPLHPELIVESGFREAGGYTAMKALLDRSKNLPPRAVVAVNDPAAFGAIKAILEAGLRIPDDIAIVGFSDDIRAALMPIPLTTVRQPAYEVGKMAAQKLLAVIEGTSPEIEEIIINTEQVIRDSCGHH